MTFTDPHSRALRGELSGAVRRGDLEAEREIRHELALRAVESSIVKQIGDTQLSALEVTRLRRVVEFHGLDLDQRAAVEAERRRVEAEKIKAKIDELQARLVAATGASTVEPAEDDLDAAVPA